MRLCSAFRFIMACCCWERGVGEDAIMHAKEPRKERRKARFEMVKK